MYHMFAAHLAPALSQQQQRRQQQQQPDNGGASNSACCVFSKLNPAFSNDTAPKLIDQLDACATNNIVEQDATDMCARTLRAMSRVLLLAPSDLLPCQYCRRSFQRYVRLPDYRIDMFLNGGKLEEFVYLVHNKVNRKLGKPLAPFAILDIYRGADNMAHLTAMHFWMWLQAVAFNYPADLQLQKFWLGESRCRFGFPPGSSQAVELRQRMQTYISVIDMLRHYLPPESALLVPWCIAYIAHTPSPWTFACRTNLLRWVFEMQQACGCGQGTFVHLLEELHPMRSS
jgi:hypothetical protein